ncbi:MAG: hypothetical protein LUQ07_05150 [Methanospirillum sp.]|nr:hypothetical protein [Methanospirillum sp.]
MGIVFGVVAMVFLIGVSPVMAELQNPQPLDIGQPKTYPSFSIFSPAPNYLAIQTPTTYYHSDNIFTAVLEGDFTNTGGHPQLQSFSDIIRCHGLSGQAGNPCQAGFRSAYINGVNYIFAYDFSTGQTSIDSFTMNLDDSGGWSGSWGAKKTVLNYAWDNAGSNNRLFQVCGTDDGVYLIRRINTGGTEALDVFFIPIEDLEGSATDISAQPVYSLTNNDPGRPGFSPVPDTEIYDAIVTTHMYTDKPVIIWTYDLEDTVVTSFIGPDNYYGEKTIVDQDAWVDTYKGKPATVVLTEGSYAENPSGVNNINAIVCGDSTLADPPALKTYTCDVASFPTDPWVEQSMSISEPVINDAMGYGVVSDTLMEVPIVNSANAELVTFIIALRNTVIGSSDPEYPWNAYYSYLTCYNSDMLIVNNTVTSFDTQNDFDDYANLAIPVGFVDGAPPFSYNGYECDGVEVTSEVELSKSDTDTTETAGTASAKATVSYANKFMEKRVGLDMAVSGMVEDSDKNGIDFKETTIDTISQCSMNGHSNGFILYLAPNLVTHAYNLADYNGVLSATYPEILYLTTMNPSSPVSAHAQGYNISKPQTSGPLAGMMTSPTFDNFDEWDWADWSGGWYDRDWTQTPYAANFTLTNLGNNLEWSMGIEQRTEYEMTTSTSNTEEVEGDEDASVRILGLGAGETFTYEDEKTFTNAINEGISFLWNMKEVDDDVCGYDTVHVEPVILTPLPGKKVPWVPDTFSEYQPWLLTYNLLTAEPSEGCYTGEAMEQKVKTSVVPAGAGTITLPEGGIQKGMTGKVSAVPAEGYRFLHWEAYGLDIADSSSPVMNATVKNQISTLRAFFAKNSSDVVDTAIIAVQNRSPGDQIKIQGTIPSGFNKSVAMNLKKPVTVRVGDMGFPFGPAVGNRTIVSDHEIAFTTEDPEKGVSHLRMDFGSGKWWFTANEVQDIARYGLRSNIVRIGIGCGNLSAADEVLMSGKETISWSGSDENVSNSVFSLKNATLRGTIGYLEDDDKASSLVLNGATLAGSVNATMPVRIKVNGVDVAFSIPTEVNGNTYTYSRTSPDLNATVTIRNDTRALDIVLSGKQLSHTFWGAGIPVGIQAGKTKALELIHPNQTVSLRTPNIAISSDESH